LASRLRFGAKEEAEWQRNRWKTRELVTSRKHLSDYMKRRPWIPYFYRTMLMSRTGGRISGLLDVGCGTGFLTRLFGRELIPEGKVSNTIGVDINQKSLRAAKEEEVRYPLAAKRRIEYVQADAYHLPFRSDSFGLVTSRTVLMHLSSPVKAVREMTRVCRRNGLVAHLEPDWGAFSGYNPGDQQTEKEDEAALIAEIKGRRKLYGQDPAIGRRLPYLLHRAGLRDISIDGIFEGRMTPCDYRTKRRNLIQEHSLSLKNLSDKKRTEEYTKVLIAGGLSEAWVQRYLRRRKARLIRRLKRLKLRGSKEKMTSFWAVPFFLAMGKK
jgi:SAM-dependent methyltransferase